MSQNLNFLMVSNGFRATKIFKKIGDKWELSEDYDAGMYFKGFEIPVKSLNDVFEILEENQEYPVFMIHGGFIDGIDKKNMVRRSRDKNKDGKKPTITDRNIHLFCLDIDGFKDHHNIDKFIKDNLPQPFHKVDYIYQYSSSYGLTSDTLKCHLFFWLDKPAHNIDIRNWIKIYNTAKGWGNILDPSVLNCAQPVYIQKRICENADDPVENFIGYVKKDGNLDFEFDHVETEEKKTTVPKKIDYDLKSGVEKILKSENYHDELNKLALSLINKKVPPTTVKDMLKGAMNTAEIKDERWQNRYDDIDRTVDSAVDIVDNPTLEEVLQWIHSEETLTVEANFAQKVLNLSPIDRTKAISKICKKTGFGVMDIKKTIKIAETEDKKRKIEAVREQKRLERQQQGIYEVEILPNNLGSSSNLVCKILKKSKRKPEIYSAGNSLVTIDLATPSTIRQALKFDTLGADYPKMPIIVSYRKPFYDLAARIEQDVVFTNSDGVEIESPTRLLYVVGESHNKFKPLTGVVEHPFISEDWKLIKTQGYDEKTGLFSVLHDKLKIQKIHPLKALKFLLDEVFAEFPFDTKLDKIVAVAALMTAIQRPSISGDSGFPGFGIVSPTQSSGKTTLAQLISYSIFNRPVAAATFPENDDEELNKTLLGILSEGHSCVLFDNIKQGTQINSDVLARVMSSDSFRGRKLGENKTVEVPCSCLWLFTGNGISFSGDFATRVYPININPKMSDPNTRSFKRENIGKWTLDNRKKIISAVLSIIIEGKNINLKTETRFKEWDRFVRQPLLKISGIDINDAVKKNQFEDPLKLAKGNFFYELSVTFEDEEFSTKDIIDKAFSTFEGEENGLSDAMEELFGDKKRKTQSIGMLLSSMVNEVANGFYLQKKVSNITKWRIKKVKQ